MEGLKLISIVLSTFNGEKYIEEQLDSILNQTYINLEVIEANIQSDHIHSFGLFNST